MKNIIKIYFIIISFSVLSSSCAINRTILNYNEPNTPRYFDTKIIKPDLEHKKIFKVVSYNIKHGENIESARDLLKNNKNLKDADIICLQEMNPKSVYFLANELGYNYIYYPSTIHPETKKDYGDAVLTKSNIITNKKILLPHVKEERGNKIQRIAVGAEIILNNKKTWIFSTHLGLIISPEHRKNQINTILAAIPENCAYCIVAGDFNSYTKKSIDFITDAFKSQKFINATENVTWSYQWFYFFGKKVKLDHIFCKGFSVIQSGHVEDFKPSDHLPIWTEIEAKDV